MSGYFFAPHREHRWKSKKGIYVSEFLQIIDNLESPADHSAYSKKWWGVGELGSWGDGEMGEWGGVFIWYWVFNNAVVPRSFGFGICKLRNMGGWGDGEMGEWGGGFIGSWVINKMYLQNNFATVIFKFRFFPGVPYLGQYNHATLPPFINTFINQPPHLPISPFPPHPCIHSIWFHQTFSPTFQHSNCERSELSSNK